MKRDAPLKTRTTEDLVQAYREAAAQQWSAIASGKKKAAQSSSVAVVRIYSELRQRGVNAQGMLLTLLHDIDPGVRVWAASHAMEFAPDKGEPVLRELAEQPRGLTGLIAEHALRQWRDGTLFFP